MLLSNTKASGCRSVSRRCAQGSVVTITVSLLLAACGGGSEDPNRIDFEGLSVHGLGGADPAQVSTPWLATTRVLRFESIPTAGNVTVGLLNYEPPRSIQDDIDFRLGQLSLDTCRLIDQNAGNNTPNTGSRPPYVSGGDSLTINSSSGPWMIVNRDQSDYWQPGLPTAPFPADATLSIPGDEFPNVSAYKLYNPTAPVRISPEYEAAVNGDTMYSWVSDGINDTYINMAFLEFNSEGENQGAMVICDVIDDGQFELPDDAKAAIAATSNEVKVRYDRVSRRIDYLNGISFFQTISVGE